MKDLTRLQPQVHVAREAQARIPYDERTGFALGLFRADLLPRAPAADSEDLMDFSQELENSYVPLQFDQGYPTLPSGLPVWSQLPWEPLSSFRAFECYLQQTQASNSRQSPQSPQIEDIQAQAHSSESASKRLTKVAMRRLDILCQEPFLQTELDITPQEVQESYYLYFWRIRAEAFDLYCHMARRIMRHRESLELQDKQKDLSDTLLTKAMEYINGEEFEALLTPKVAIELLRTAVSLQRINVGLPAQAPAGKEPQEVDEMLQEVGIARRNAQDEDPNEGIYQDILLNDVEATEMAQELVIRIRQGQRRYSGGSGGTAGNEVYRNEGRLDRPTRPLIFEHVPSGHSSNSGSGGNSNSNGEIDHEE